MRLTEGSGCPESWIKVSDEYDASLRSAQQYIAEIISVLAHSKT